MSSFTFNETEVNPLCDGVWEQNTNSYRKASSLEKIKCCLKSCENHIKFCYEKGYKNCDNLVSSCEDGCYQIESKGLKVICDCAEKSNCGTYPNYDPECVKREEQNILECCKKNCPKNECISDNSCSDYIAFIKADIRSPLSELKKTKMINNEQKKYKKDIKINLLILSLIILFFLLISLLRKNDKRKK